MTTLWSCLAALLTAARDEDDDEMAMVPALASIAAYDAARPNDHAGARARRLDRLDAAFSRRAGPTFAALLIQMEIASRKLRAAAPGGSPAHARLAPARAACGRAA